MFCSELDDLAGLLRREFAMSREDCGQRRSLDELASEEELVARMTQFVDLRSAVATPESLLITGVTISGSGASKFTRTSDTCNLATLQPGLSCRVTLKFNSPDTAGALVQLNMTMRQGASATVFTRTVLLNGVVTSATPPPSGGGSTGGGALGWPWLAALALGIAALLRRRA